jgi:hypothetical protein
MYPAFSFTLEIIFDSWSLSTSINTAKFAKLSDSAFVKREQLSADKVRRARRTGDAPERAALRKRRGTLSGCNIGNRAVRIGLLCFCVTSQSRIEPNDVAHCALSVDCRIASRSDVYIDLTVVVWACGCSRFASRSVRKLFFKIQCHGPACRSQRSFICALTTFVAFYFISPVFDCLTAIQLSRLIAISDRTAFRTVLSEVARPEELALL